MPISFNTHWNDEGGYIDVDTAIQVHEALEKEFGIDIKDRNILITDVETAYFVVTQHHDAIWSHHDSVINPIHIIIGFIAFYSVERHNYPPPHPFPQIGQQMAHLYQSMKYTLIQIKRLSKPTSTGLFFFGFIGVLNKSKSWGIFPMFEAGEG